MKTFTFFLMVFCFSANAEEKRSLTIQDITAIGLNEWGKYILGDVDIAGEGAFIEYYDNKTELIKEYGVKEAHKVRRERASRPTSEYTGQKAGIVSINNEDIPRQNRSIKECIKPNNVIDEAVIACTRWKIEKSW